MGFRIWVLRQWHEQRVATLFLIFGAFFGMLFVLLVPPTQTADETTHFYRAYQLSEGHVLSKAYEQGFGDYMPEQIHAVSRQLFGDIPSHYERTFVYTQLPALLKQKIDFNSRTFVHLEGATVYSPVGYLPQVVGILLCKLLWPSVALMYYAGRVLNLLLFLILVYVAIRLWPGNKWILFAIALLPMTLSQAASFSPDATINSLAFLTIAGVLYVAKRKERITPLTGVLLVAAIVLLSLCKPVLFVLGILAFVCLRRHFVTKWGYALFIGAMVGGGLLATGIWNMQVKDYSAGIQHYYYNGIHIDEHKQLERIITHPTDFIRTLGDSYLSSNGDVVTRTLVGRLGWWDVDMPLWFLVCAYALVALAVVAAERTFSRREKLVTGGVFVLGWLAISVVLYMTISAVGAPAIAGIQGRYFLAFLPLLAVAFSGLITIKDWASVANKLYPVSYFILLSVSMLVMVNRFI